MTERSAEFLNQSIGPIVENESVRRFYELGFTVLDSLVKEQAIRSQKKAVELLPDGRIITLSHTTHPDQNFFFIKIRQSPTGEGAKHSTNFLWEAANPDFQRKTEHAPGRFDRQVPKIFTDEDIQIMEEVATAVLRNRHRRGVL